MSAILSINRMISGVGFFRATLFGMGLLALFAGSSIAAAKTLNRTAIHQAYRDGEFEKVTQGIEGFTKANSTYSAADSLFVAKHLAVVYAANPQTREKGKYYMYRMFEVTPQADLVDMFVSDDVDAIFEKVRKEYLSQHPELRNRTKPNPLAKQDSPDNSNSSSTSISNSNSNSEGKRPIPVPKQASMNDKKKSNTVWWWVAGGAAMLLT